jgi:hypothetical protein
VAFYFVNKDANSPETWNCCRAIAKIAKPTVETSGYGTPESGKIRLVEPKKIAKEKSEIAMLCERSSRMLLKGDEGG